MECIIFKKDHEGEYATLKYNTEPYPLAPRPGYIITAGWHRDRVLKEGHLTSTMEGAVTKEEAISVIERSFPLEFRVEALAALDKFTPPDSV